VMKIDFARNRTVRATCMHF